MNLTETIHGRYVFGRRIRVLSGRLAPLIPEGARVLDVGCGDGQVARLLMQSRPDITLKGVDVLVRERAHIPVDWFDGKALPFEDDSFDCVLFVDVLHHTEDPLVLLREAARVARDSILIKDHLRDGLLAGSTLRFMDDVGNARFGVALPHKYWPSRRWSEAFAELGMAPDPIETRIGLYPWWADWAFGRGLHFVARLRPESRWA